MNILFLDSWLRSRSAGSGTAVAIAGLERGLRAAGHCVETIRPRARLPAGDVGRLWYNATLPRRLSRRLHAGPPVDLVIGFDFDGVRVSGRLPVPYVVALKGVAADEQRFERGVSRMRFGVYRRLEARNARRADRVIVSSRYSAGRAVELYGLNPASVEIAPEGLDEAMASLAAEVQEGARPTRPVILSVARQYPRKDTSTLLQAFARISPKFPDAVLRVVGSGPALPGARDIARRLGIGDRVEFVGSVDSLAELAAAYRSASMFALPSLQEGFGIVWLEAMAFGLPIVAVKAGATPEVAPHGEVALLSEPGDPAGLAASIARILEDGQLAGRLGAAGRERARRFSWPAAAGAFLRAACDVPPYGPGGTTELARGLCNT